jgi:cytochrome o ubiquinol oxidase subunit 3
MTTSGQYQSAASKNSCASRRSRRHEQSATRRISPSRPDNLLSSSFACGLALLAAKAGDKRAVLAWLAVTAALGIGFLGIELTEFHQLAIEGNSWRRSSFLSSFFTLVGTHGLHISAGLLWLATLGWSLWRKGLNPSNLRRLTLFSMFWHFLDLVWIFIFTVVYLTGGLGL